MTSGSVDGSCRRRIAELGARVLDGGDIGREEALWLFRLSSRGEIFELLSWAHRIREQFRGNRIHLCSIVNVKAGGCPEDCRFCAQSALYQTEAPRYGLLEAKAVRQAAEEARANGVLALGIVAAWRELEEGRMLEQVCEQLGEIRSVESVRADGSLGMIRSQGVADKLKEAGLEVYNHNLESSRRFFPQTCTSHSYDDRLRTIQHLKAAGIRVCSGGIIGLGETAEDRCDLAFALKAAGAEIVPLNILNPIQGTPMSGREPVPPLEALKTIACFRFLLPNREIKVAGGRTVNLREVQSLIFMAGASALMVGNYLTTLGPPVEKDLQMLKDLGLEALRS